MDATIRKIVRKECNYSCQICHKQDDKNNPTFQIHHIQPKSEGGTDEKDNLTLLCPDCHKAIHGIRTQESDKSSKHKKRITINPILETIPQELSNTLIRHYSYENDF